MKALPSIEQFENDVLPLRLVALSGNIPVIYIYMYIIEIDY